MIFDRFVKSKTVAEAIEHVLIMIICAIISIVAVMLFSSIFAKLLLGLAV